MIDWLASEVLILFYKTLFFSLIVCHYGFSKDFQILKFSWAYSAPGTETVQQIPELWVKWKKSYWDWKLHPSCLAPLVLSVFNLPCQLLGVITFEQVISLHWNFQDNLISYIPFIWKSFIKIWNGSCPDLWNFGPFDMEWPYLNI